MTLPQVLERLRAAYIARHPTSAAVHARATSVMPGGNMRSVLFYDPFPLAIARGAGARLWDADGHEYLDFIGEFTAGLYGHSHPVIRQAIEEALDGGLNLSGHNLLEARLARLVTERFPTIEQVRFTNSGTEANLMAIAAAKHHTGRRKVLVFRGAYHGGVLSFADGPSPVNVPHEFVLARYNDLDDAAALARQHAHDLAAILVEPMQGAAGCIVGRPAFLHGLRTLADQTGALLIFDEVMTSRLAPGGRQQALRIRPDLTTLGKYIGGGLSFGAFGGRRDVMALFDPRTPGHLGHAGTFNNNVLSMAAGIAGLGRVYTPEVSVALNARGDRLRERLNTVCRDGGVALQFSGLGSLMSLHPTALEIERGEDLPADGQAVRDLFFFAMLEQGFYLARRGFVVLSLPLTDDDLDRFAAAVARFVAAYAAVLPRR
jgi:glutamate-1-semialdehyde 2,1-aminomutase